MASAEVPVVLRVKRKRTEDPADALGKLMCIDTLARIVPEATIYGLINRTPPWKSEVENTLNTSLRLSLTLVEIIKYFVLVDSQPRRCNKGHACDVISRQILQISA